MIEGVTAEDLLALGPFNGDRPLLLGLQLENRD